MNAGRVEAAWDLVMDMEECGLKADHYTCSIMLKTIKGPSLSKRAAQRALRLVERSGVDLCADEVLLNTVLDVCIRTRDLEALRSSLARFSAQTNLKPSVPTYGTLIKAYGLLRNVKMCRQLFKEIEDREITINDITFGCMLDSLVTNDCLTEAHKLLDAWKPKIPSNTVMYSTLLKGCARKRDADMALKIFEEMVADGVRPNAVSFNTAIDACAAGGKMNQAAILLQRMRDAGQSPDMVTYATIIKGYAVLKHFLIWNAFRFVEISVYDGFRFLHRSHFFLKSFWQFNCLCFQLVTGFRRSGTSLPEFRSHVP